MIDWFEKYRHCLLNESYLVDIDDEDDDSLDADDELISKSGKVLSMGDLGEHKHIMCFKISGVTFSGENLKNRLADFQDNFMELVEDVMYIEECATNFIFDLGYVPYSMSKEGIANADIPTYEYVVSDDRDVMVAGTKEDNDEIINHFGSRRTHNKVYAYFSFDSTKMNVKRLAKFINNLIAVFQRAVAMSLGRATPNMIVYGNDFRNGINRSANKRIQDKVGGKDKLKAWCKKFMQFVDFHDINDFYNDNEISPRGLSFLKQLHIKPVMKWVTEDENGVVHINVPRGSGKPLELDLDYILNSYILLNKLKLDIDSTLCVHCNSLKALALLKKIVVHCNYCKVLIKDDCDFGSLVVDVTDYNIDDLILLPEGIISKLSPAKLVTFKTKRGTVALP